MQRKPSYPVANCNIKMPETIHPPPELAVEDEGEQQQRRLQLINFGHAQWGFNNWSWAVTKQELDFVDFANGKYTAGVVAFVSITVKSSDIHRENIGYATSVAVSKGSAIYKSRKCAVTNALRETFLSFGGSVATELTEILDSTREHEPLHENNPNVPNVPPPQDRPKNLPPPPLKNACANAPPVAKAAPMPLAPPRVPPPASVPPPPRAPPRPPSNAQEVKPAEVVDEEARAERKRRQRQAQEEFRLKQMLKHKTIKEERPSSPHRNSSGFDKLLSEIPTQDIEIEQTGSSEEGNKRKSPAPEGSSKKRISRLDIVQTK